MDLSIEYIKLISKLIKLFKPLKIKIHRCACLLWLNLFHFREPRASVDAIKILAFLR